jgi:hypothetical protein
MEIDRALRVFDFGKKAANPRGRLTVDFAFGGNPAIAARPT